MLNTADDPVQFLKNEAAYAGEDAAAEITRHDELYAHDGVAHEDYIVSRARRAWRFALAAEDLALGRKIRAVITRYGGTGP